MARKPENIPGYDRLSPRAKLILTGQSVYDIPVDQRGTVFPTSPTPPTLPEQSPEIRNGTINKFKLTMSEMKSKLGTPALTSDYYVELSIPSGVDAYLNNVKSVIGLEKDELVNFVNRRLGYMCSEATLPVSSYATAEVKDNFVGVTQEFAHTRLYTDLDLTFYVDNNYLSMRYFELWMDYISGASNSLSINQSLLSNQQLSIADLNSFSVSKGHYKQFHFPDQYKSDAIRIYKFERNLDTQLVYTFINAFPKGLTSVPVSYGSSELLKITVTLNYDRYIVGRAPINTPRELVNIVDELRKKPLF